MPIALKGDCLEVMKTLPDTSVDCFVCDLPYGCLGPQKKGGGIPREGTDGAFGGCPWDVKIDLAKFWEQVKRLAKNDHTPVLMFCDTRQGAELIASNPTWFRQDLVWSKTNAVGFLLANKMPLRSHEMIYVFAKKGAQQKRMDIEGDFPSHHSRGDATETTSRTYNGGKPLPIVCTTSQKGGMPATSSGKGRAGGSIYNIKKKGIVECNVQDCAGREKPIERYAAREGIRCVKSVITVANKKGKGRHPTQKPDELYQWLLERQCPEGGLVLDPTAGSFSSCRVAVSLGLQAIGIELDETFFQQFGIPLNTEKDPKVEDDAK